MAKTAGRVVVAMGLVVVGLAGITPAASAAKLESPVRSITLMVLVDNRAGVPAKILEKAREDAERVFQDMKIAIVWLEPGDARLGTPDVFTSVDVVRLLPQAMTDQMNAPSLCGLAEAGTRVAYVFYNRIQRVSSIRTDADTGNILGHVIAHEIGHLLLPPNAHSRFGIMQAVLDQRLAAMNGLFFTPSQARSIRTRLGAN